MIINTLIYILDILSVPKCTEPENSSPLAYGNELQKSKSKLSSIIRGTKKEQERKSKSKQTIFTAN